MLADRSASTDPCRDGHERSASPLLRRPGVRCGAPSSRPVKGLRILREGMRDQPCLVARGFCQQVIVYEGTDALPLPRSGHRKFGQFESLKQDRLGYHRTEPFDEWQIALFELLASTEGDPPIGESDELLIDLRDYQAKATAGGMVEKPEYESPSLPS